MQHFLNALSPLDGRYQKQIQDLSNYFSERALIQYRTQVEIEWLIALSNHPTIEAISPLEVPQQEKLRAIYKNFSLEDGLAVKEIEKTTNHDVKAVEYFINSKLTELGLEVMIPMVHFACTSEDINNLAYSLMLRDSLKLSIFPACESLLENFRDKSKEYRNVRMVSRTHGQLASPTTMGKEFHNVCERFQRQLDKMKAQEILGKINGAVGNFNAHVISYPQVNWKEFSKNFVESLGLIWNSATTQIEPHDYLAEMFHHFCHWNTILLDFNRDIWSYISIEAFRQIPVAGQTGSSTMPHKVNPIDFENSEGNLGLANAIFDHLALKLPVSRWQRDLTDSTVLRNIGVAFGYSVLAYKATQRGLSKLAINQAKLEKELSESWGVLGEAIQTVMRRYAIPEPYEKLKELTRGKEIDQESLVQFIKTLDLSEEEIQRLIQLTPLDYVGLATEY